MIFSNGIFVVAPLPGLLLVVEARALVFLDPILFPSLRTPNVQKSPSVPNLSGKKSTRKEPIEEECLDPFSLYPVHSSLSLSSIGMMRTKVTNFQSSSRER